LADELQFTRDYLALQRLRYRDRLQVQIEGESGEALGAACPPLLLQPLVENALRHGLDRQAGRLDVHIGFIAKDDKLCVRIVNPLIGEGPANPGGGTGAGATTARRANHLWPIPLPYGRAQGTHWLTQACWTLVAHVQAHHFQLGCRSPASHVTV